jgi:hypothetical protein
MRGDEPALASPDFRVLRHAAGVSGALLLALAIRGAIDPHVPSSLYVTTLDTLQGLPLAVASVTIAAASFGAYTASRLLTVREAVAIAALAVALQQPFASAMSGGTPFPLIVIPLEAALIAAALLIAERAHRSVDGS